MGHVCLIVYFLLIFFFFFLISFVRLVAVHTVHSYCYFRLYMGVLRYSIDYLCSLELLIHQVQHCYPVRLPQKDNHVIAIWTDLS